MPELYEDMNDYSALSNEQLLAHHEILKTLGGTEQDKTRAEILYRMNDWLGPAMRFLHNYEMTRIISETTELENGNGV
jgi:hypothetical protein